MRTLGPFRETALPPLGRKNADGLGINDGGPGRMKSVFWDDVREKGRAGKRVDDGEWAAPPRVSVATAARFPEHPSSDKEYFILGCCEPQLIRRRVRVLVGRRANRRNRRHRQASRGWSVGFGFPSLISVPSSLVVTRRFRCKALSSRRSF
jgi:hypothetical protein